MFLFWSYIGIINFRKAIWKGINKVLIFYSHRADCKQIINSFWLSIFKTAKHMSDILAWGIIQGYKSNDMMESNKINKTLGQKERIKLMKTKNNKETGEIYIRVLWGI